MRPMIPHHYQYATPICEVSLFHLGAFSLCEHLPRKEYRVPPRGYIQSLRAPLKFRVLPLNPQCPSLPLPLCAVKNILKNSPTFRPSLAVPNNYDVYNYCQQNVNHSPLPCPVGGFFCCLRIYRYKAIFSFSERPRYSAYDSGILSFFVAISFTPSPRREGRPGYIRKYGLPSNSFQPVLLKYLETSVGTTYQPKEGP